jgi:hypothetical protein
MSHLKDAQLEAQAWWDISQFRGTLVAPGPEFSAMKIVGESTA